MVLVVGAVIAALVVGVVATVLAADAAVAGLVIGVVTAVLVADAVVAVPVKVVGKIDR